MTGRRFHRTTEVIPRRDPTKSKSPFASNPIFQYLSLQSNLKHVRKNLRVSVKFLSAILGPEMGAPILWAPGIFAFFLQENLHVHKIPRFRGGGELFFLGGGECGFYFGGRGDFSEHGPVQAKVREPHLNPPGSYELSASRPCL